MTDRVELSPATLPAADGSSPRVNFARIAIVDLVLPFLTVIALQRWGATPLVAYAAAGLFPAGSVIATWLAKRSFELIGAFVLVAIASGFAMAVLVGDPRFALLRAAPAYAVFGVACLASLPTRRPLMFFVARSFSAGADPARLATWNARLALPGFRRAMRFLTLVWGAGALAASALKVGAAFLLPGSAAIVAEPIIAIGAVLALLAYTRGFARRAQNRLSRPGGS